MSEKKEFMDNLSEKYPNINVTEIVKILEKKLSEIHVNPLNPNQNLTLPLGCEMNKGIIVSVIDEYLNGRKIEEEKIKNEILSNSDIRDVWEEATELMRTGKYTELRRFIKSYDNDTEDVGEMRMVLIATKSMRNSDEIKDFRDNLRETLERRIGHKIH